MTLAADQCHGFKIPPVHYGLLAEPRRPYLDITSYANDCGAEKT